MSPEDPGRSRRRKAANAITISDVAAAAGVSMKTVSRVLNSEPHVREALRARVLTAVAALDFQPNASARALAGARSYLLGLYLDNPSPGYVSQIEVGAMRACRRSGYHLVVEHMSGGAASQIRDLQRTVRLDGFILTPPLCDDQTVLDALEATGTRYVRIAPAPGEGAQRAPSVIIDDRQAAYEMTRRLQQFGHSRIAFIAGPANHAAAGLRQQGFLAAMADAGIAVSPSLMEVGDFSFRSGLEAGERLVSAAPRPTAIFASNDDMALGVMAVAHRWRLEMPSALSIAGFDDSPSASVVWPQLTTVRQPVADMAAAAAEILIGWRADQDLTLVRRLDFEIVSRDSTAPPSPT